MRLFIAASLPEAVTRDLNARVQALKTKLAAASWVRPQSQHLTFAFLGEQDESLIEPLDTAVRERVRSIAAFTATLHGCGFFPNPRRARVGWIGVEPEQPLVRLAGAVRAAVEGTGVALDRADFKPHLTLMRIRDVWPPACIQFFEQALAGYESEPFVMEKVTLYSSTLNPNGAVHTPLREYPLSSRA